MRGDCVQALLAGGAEPMLRNASLMTAFDVASESSAPLTAHGARGATAASAVVRSSLTRVRPALRTLLLHHDDCYGHMRDMVDALESPSRLRAIMQEVVHGPKRFASWEATLREDFPPASYEQLCRAHDASYVREVMRLAQQVANTGSAVPFTPHLQRQVGSAEQEVKDAECSDTHFHVGTYEAAKRAAGAVCASIGCEAVLAVVVSGLT